MTQDKKRAAEALQAGVRGINVRRNAMCLELKVEFSDEWAHTRDYFLVVQYLDHMKRVCVILEEESNTKSEVPVPKFVQHRSHHCRTEQFHFQAEGIFLHNFSFSYPFLQKAVNAELAVHVNFFREASCSGYSRSDD